MNANHKKKSQVKLPAGKKLVKRVKNFLNNSNVALNQFYLNAYDLELAASNEY